MLKPEEIEYICDVLEEEIKEDGQIGDDLRGFLTDDTFFDKETDDYDWNSLYNSNKLSMIVTSIEKDLRIQIVDLFGQLVEGESFYVTVEGVGEYKDLDKDGIVYIADSDICFSYVGAGSQIKH